MGREKKTGKGDDCQRSGTVSSNNLLFVVERIRRLVHIFLAEIVHFDGSNRCLWRRQFRASALAQFQAPALEAGPGHTLTWRHLRHRPPTRAQTGCRLLTSWVRGRWQDIVGIFYRDLSFDAWRYPTCDGVCLEGEN